MDIRYIFSTAIILLSFASQVFADMPLGRVIKEQQSNDNTSVKERKIDKKDVFLEAITKKEIAEDFPSETPCYDIDELIIENDFINDRWIQKIKKESPVSAWGLMVCIKQLSFCKTILLIPGI